MSSGKELWIQAETSFIEKFFEDHGRIPTDEEVTEGMKEYYADYISGLIDHATDYGQER